MAGSDAVEASVRELRKDRPNQIIAFGVDRLDYSKGIPQRLKAIQQMLEKHEDLRGRFTYIQVSSPSRTEIQTYDAMRQEIERLVGHINGRYGGRGCIPIDYRYDTMSQQELVAHYRAADVALVTPLRDGMNLVAKEFIASRIDNDGILVLSTLAGAARELKDAVLVNPYDTEGMAEHFYSAINMPADEQRRRMMNLRNIVKRNDIYWWLERFLRDAETR
jgi:trehalose 6-phosphate synthase/phosphatase